VSSVKRRGLDERGLGCVKLSEMESSRWWFGDCSAFSAAVSRFLRRDSQVVLFRSSRLYFVLRSCDALAMLTSAQSWRIKGSSGECAAH
jgi:hypothetical protein